MNKVLIINGLIIFLALISSVVTINNNKLYFFNYKEQDYIKIKEIIMEERDATVYDKYYLDVNNDKKITSMDYVMMRNKIERDKDESKVQ